ncbi:dihydrofolate reductase [Kribbella pittospori]|uniref:Dihydrofolate reductase n=1 Tax=Kribbella pittospori TaxID=722689 RepID=A0A4R0K9I2_9ACTN|nr:dihydrofolate reductase family protein [Kribbella pittospori]TCC51885.1 dihydrofolate reductase [Kribbella pittospori]
MRELVVTQNITVDGVIEAGDWFAPVDGGDEVLSVLRDQMAQAVGFLTGRTTFEEMRGFWPAQHDDTTGVTEYLNTVQKYVVSQTLQEPGWEPTTILRGVDDVRELKSTEGTQIVCTGSIALVHALIAANLVDEYRLFVYPTVVGGGRRLFPDGTPLALRLTACTSFGSGVAQMIYRCTD